RVAEKIGSNHGIALSRKECHCELGCGVRQIRISLRFFEDCRPAKNNQRKRTWTICTAGNQHRGRGIGNFSRLYTRCYVIDLCHGNIALGGAGQRLQVVLCSDRIELRRCQFPNYRGRGDQPPKPAAIASGARSQYQTQEACQSILVEIHFPPKSLARFPTSHITSPVTSKMALSKLSLKRDPD